MAKTYIYMNHHIKDKKTTEPVITIQEGKQRIHCNTVEIFGNVTVCTGRLRASKTHVVRAWIECNPEDVDVIG